jgi:hypothetical protein
VKNLLDAFLSDFKWYRKVSGGKWELWIVDHPVCSEVWHRVDEFTRVKVAEWPKLSEEILRKLPFTALHPVLWGYRPSPLCRGTPTEEAWP